MKYIAIVALAFSLTACMTTKEYCPADGPINEQDIPQPLSPVDDPTICCNDMDEMNG